MNYEQMTQLALRGVVRDAVRRVIREDGLPGAHHFYITFMTRYPGVDIDDGLAAKYPDEITIVLEHQYWDLNAYETEFEVTLKFGGIPKYLKVPYHAITKCLITRLRASMIQALALPYNLIRPRKWTKPRNPSRKSRPQNPLLQKQSIRNQQPLARLPKSPLQSPKQKIQKPKTKSRRMMLLKTQVSAFCNTKFGRISVIRSKY